MKMLRKLIIFGPKPTSGVYFAALAKDLDTKNEYHCFKSLCQILGEVWVLKCVAF